MLPSIALPGRFGDGRIKPSLACVITNVAWLLSFSYNCSTRTEVGAFGEPDTLKGVRPVRRGVVGNVPASR